MALKIVGKIELPEEPKRVVKTRHKAVTGKIKPIKDYDQSIHYAPKRLEHLFNKQNGSCWYCGEPCTLNRTDTGVLELKNATVEHLLRKDDIRIYCCDREDYVVMACYECNTNKGYFDANRIYRPDLYQYYPLTEFVNYSKWYRKIFRKFLETFVTIKSLF